MRRRQAYALQTQQLQRKALIYSSPPAQVLEVMGGEINGCKYCGKEVARGIYMHEKYCKANPNGAHNLRRTQNADSN